MKTLVPSLLGSAVGGIVAALLVVLISTLTSGTVSPVAAGVIGIVFGVTAGNIVDRSTPASGSRKVLIAILRGAVAGIAAMVTVFLIQGA